MKSKDVIVLKKILDYCMQVDEEKSIPWRSWCGIRDIFAHQYSNLDNESAWDTIQNDLPVLRENVNRILLEHEKHKQMRDNK